MKTIYQIRGVICRFFMQYELIAKVLLKFCAYLFIFRQMGRIFFDRRFERIFSAYAAGTFVCPAALAVCGIFLVWNHHLQYLSGFFMGSADGGGHSPGSLCYGRAPVSG